MVASASNHASALPPVFIPWLFCLQFFPRSELYDAGDIKGFTLLISVGNDNRPLYQLHLVRTNGHLVKMETAASYVPLHMGRLVPHQLQSRGHSM